MIGVGGFGYDQFISTLFDGVSLIVDGSYVVVVSPTVQHIYTQIMYV